MIHVLIVDDEELARNKIRGFLQKLETKFLITEARNGIEALKILSETKIDLLFLDIEMPGLTGLQVLQNIEKRPFKVIFQTAYAEFALKAFEENACDYLLKPFDLARFKKAVDKALHREESANSLTALEKTLREDSQFLEKVSVSRGSAIRLLSVEEIECFTSKDHYTFACFGKEEWICDLSLEFLEERLDPKKFIRIHRNGIVQISKMKSLHGKSQMEIELSSGLRLAVARARQSAIKSLFT
jgi:two-component system LytT family response regulator